MKDNEEKIRYIIKEEYLLYQKLYEISLKKEEVILSDDIEELNELTFKENKLIEEVKNLSEKREKFNIESDNINLYYKLINLAEKFREKNLLNFKLIKDKMQLNNLNIAIKTGKSEHGTYTKNGKYENKQQRSMLNHRA